MINDSGDGGARHAWQNQPATMLHIPTHVMNTRVSSIDALLRRAKFAVTIGGIGSTMSLGWLLYSFSAPIVRIGTVLTVAGVAFVIYQVLSHVATMRKVSNAMIAEPSAVTYRAVLERHRQFYDAVPMWSRLLTLFPGPLIVLFGTTGGASPDMETIVTAAAFVALALGMVVHNRTVAKRYQAEIEEIDAWSDR